MDIRNGGGKFIKVIKIFVNVQVTGDCLGTQDFVNVDGFHCRLFLILSVRHPDYIDNPTKIALQNRLYLDGLLAKREVIKKITLDFDDEPILPCTLRNGRRRDQSPLEKRNLRSKSTSTTPDDNFQLSDKVNSERVRLLMTNPYVVSWIAYF